MEIKQKFSVETINVLLNVKLKELNYRKVKRDISQITNIYKAVKKV